MIGTKNDTFTVQTVIMMKLIQKFIPGRTQSCPSRCIPNKRDICQNVYTYI